MEKELESPLKKQKVQQTLPTFFYEVASTIEEEVADVDDEIYVDAYGEEIDYIDREIQDNYNCAG
jgi:hypothetical protein